MPPEPRNPTITLTAGSITSSRVASSRTQFEAEFGALRVARSDDEARRDGRHRVAAALERHRCGVLERAGHRRNRESAAAVYGDRVGAGVRQPDARRIGARTDDEAVLDAFARAAVDEIDAGPQFGIDHARETAHIGLPM